MHWPATFMDRLAVAVGWPTPGATSTVCAEMIVFLQVGPCPKHRAYIQLGPCCSAIVDTYNDRRAVRWHLLPYVAHVIGTFG